MTTGKFLLFNISFWLVVVLVSFANGWTNAQNHMDVAYVRYFYLVLIGLVVSFAMSGFYKGDFFKQKQLRLLWVVATSATAALLTALLLNPITYLMVGYNIHNVQQEILSSGTLYFSLYYMLWSALYFQLSDQSLLAGEREKKPGPHQVFKVEKMGEKRLLQDHDICCIIASGDYVKLVTAQNSYMVKDTLANLENQLDSERFMRVHRSTIINVSKVESVVQNSGGVYEITLEGGHGVQSSRSYKALVDTILPQG